MASSQDNIVPSSQSPSPESIPSLQDLCTCENQAAHWDDTGRVHPNLPPRCLLFLSAPRDTQDNSIDEQHSKTPPSRSHSAPPLSRDTVPLVPQPTSNTIPPPAIVRSQSVASVVQIKPEAVDDLPVPNRAPSTPPAIAPARTPTEAPAHTPTKAPARAPTEAPALVDVDIPAPDAPPAYIGEDVANFFNLPNGANNRVQGAPEVADGAVNDGGIDALNAHAGNLGLRRAGEGGVMRVLGKHRMQQMLLLRPLTKKKT
ncbi:hypothetical protein BJ165DRAFT_1530156 [Panaeolus papilionaceus]|nr:hypothetical protein BJ165DRAFT_1530156 [Panaeolus papilionaceus]